MKRGGITRSDDHKYTYAGVTYPGVTSILKVLDKSDVLTGWAAKVTAEAAVRMAVDGTITSVLNDVGAAGLQKALANARNDVRDESARIGTVIHGYADDLVSGRPFQLPGDVIVRVRHYADWWAASGWTLRLSEAMVVGMVGYGGTFDLLARDADGSTVMADIKTGKGVYKEAALQLAAYGMADLVAPAGSDTVYPMPKVDRYVVLHVTEKGVREIPMVVGESERIAFYACMALTQWVDSTKGRRL